MKRNGLLILTFIAAAFFAESGANAQNNPPARNAQPSNTNAPKPVSEAPTIDALLALDKQANQAYVNSDSKFFERLLSEKFVMREGGQRMDKDAVVKMIAGVKCDIKT